MSTYVPIQAITLSSAAASITFTGIPQTYTDLVLVANLRSSDSRSGLQSAPLRFNNDSSSLYSKTAINGNGSTTSSYRQANQTGIELSCTMNGSTAGEFLLNKIHIMNYSNSTTNKTILFKSSSPLFQVTAEVALYRSTSPITSLTITEGGSLNFVAGTTATLYGVAAGTTKAIGGEVYVSGGYAYHTFRQSAQFIPAEDLTVDYLVVAGGGGGASRWGGGGGAGGVRSTVTATGGGGTLESGLAVSANTNYTVLVGAGGAGGNGPSGYNKGANGTDSVFATITSIGGGGGGTGTTLYPNTGGSGGGSGFLNNNTLNVGAAGTANQGYAGGSTQTSGAYLGGGGGGAGQVGANAVFNTSGGNGGNGVQITALSTPTNTGSSGYYGGGGGGGAESAAGDTPGSGGLGGGGAGANTAGSTATSGINYTGGGGGGGGNDTGTGGNGGSGIVIIRYAV